MIPLFHDLAGERVLVVGGGAVGARKARRFAAEADVVAVAPAFADADFGDAQRVRAALSPADAADWVEWTAPALVVAATGEEALNDALERAAREAGAMVNRADEAGGRDDPDSVVVPATVRDGDVTVAISTGGASPALSRHLRERFEGELAGAGEMAALTARLRDDLKAAEIPPEERREAVRRVVRDSRIWKALRTGGSNARREADAVVSEVVGTEWSP